MSANNYHGDYHHQQQNSYYNNYGNDGWYNYQQQPSAHNHQLLHHHEQQQHHHHQHQQHHHHHQQHHYQDEATVNVETASASAVPPPTISPQQQQPPPEQPPEKESPPPQPLISSTRSTTSSAKKKVIKKSNGGTVKKKSKRKQPQQQSEISSEVTIPSDLDEKSTAEIRDVSARFSKGCECSDQNCFSNLKPESVYKHRLNIMELSKLEHDMYLMGLTMASMENPDETVRHKERKRIRAKYRFKGREVCLDAFLYLENTTLYQLKSIRKHVISNGVTPRVHGNQGKRPHNTFSFDIYQAATKFLQIYLEKNCIKDLTARKKGLILLPNQISCKKIHSEYQQFCLTQDVDNEADRQVMGYSSFRHFLKEQFPNVRFQKDENINSKNQSSSTNQQQQHGFIDH